LRSLASYQSALIDSKQAERNLHLAKSNLIRLMGRAPGSEVEVSGDFEIPPPPSENVDWLALAKVSPTYVQNSADVNAAESAITISRAGFLPTLSVNGSISRQGASISNTDSFWSVGTTLTIPIFSGGSTYYDLQASRANRDKAEANLKKSELQVLQNLKQAFWDLKTSIERVEVQKQAVEAAELRVQVARKKYANGLQSFEDWDLIENDLVNQKQQMLSNNLQAVSADASWEQAKGVGVEK
jgi:outer membrane protein TolC